MVRAYDETIKLTWSLPPERVLPANPDPLSPNLPRPPPGTHRIYITSPAGPLEVLYSLPGDVTLESPVDESWKSPVLFLHGGFGSAGCYSNFLPCVFLVLMYTNLYNRDICVCRWFAARGYPSYSLSVRRHGHS